MIKTNVNIILKEISVVLANINEDTVDTLIRDILSARTVVTCGAGRMGIAASAFSMRLVQLGLIAHHVGSLTVPHIGKGDLLLLCSGSGETQTIYDIGKIAKESKAKIDLITGNKVSRMAKIADFVYIIPAPSKVKSGTIKSTQPMTTLQEQSLSIFFDALVLLLMKKSRRTEAHMWARHSNLE